MKLRNIFCREFLFIILLFLLVNVRIGNAQVLVQPTIGTITSLNNGTDRIIEIMQDVQDEESETSDKIIPKSETEPPEIEIFYPPSEVNKKYDDKASYSDKNSELEAEDEIIIEEIKISDTNMNHNTESENNKTLKNDKEIVAAVSGGTLKVDTGNGGEIKNKVSGVDVGFIRKLKTSSGNLFIGGIVDYNHDNYDNNFHSADGSGESDSLTFGVVAKQMRDDGVYYEGSARFGRAKTELTSDDFITANKQLEIKYEKSAPVYAGHAKVGKIVKLSDKETADIYGSYVFSHQKRTDIKLSTKETYNLGSIDSNRLKLGCRMTTKVKNGKIYYGLAYQYEASANIKARHNNENITSASAKGSTGLLELGYKISASKDKTMNVDLNATGFAGRQKGFIVQAQFVKLL